MKNAPSPLKVMLVALFTLLAGFGSALASTADTTPREENIQTIRSFLGEEDVQTALLQNGISAQQVEEVKGNLDRLSDSQIQTLAMNLDQPSARPEESPTAGGGSSRTTGEGRRIQSDLPDPHRSRHHRRHHVPHVPPAPPAVGRVEICCKTSFAPLPPGEGWGEGPIEPTACPTPRPLLPARGEGILSATWQGKVKPSRCPELARRIPARARTAPAA